MDKTIERITTAILLIYTGIILFLNTTGIVSYKLWVTFFIIMTRIWPVVLISLGIQIIFSKSIYLKSILNILWLVLLSSLLTISILVSLGKINLPENWQSDKIEFINLAE